MCHPHPVAVVHKVLVAAIVPASANLPIHSALSVLGTIPAQSVPAASATAAVALCRHLIHPDLAVVAAGLLAVAADNSAFLIITINQF